MYYRGGPQGIREDGTNAEVTCYAESADGIHWIKPKLGLYEIAGSKENNVVLAGMAPSSHNFTPLLDTKPDVPREERYKALANGKPFGDFNLAFVCFLLPLTASTGGSCRKSPSWGRSTPAATGPSTSQNVAFWSPSEEMYVCYFRKVTNSLRTVSRTTSKDFINWSAPEPMRYSNTGTTTPANQLYTNQTQPYFRAAYLPGNGRALHGSGA